MDLIDLKGIGPKLAALLAEHEIGLEELATSDVEYLEELCNAAGVKHFGRAQEWIEAARAALGYEDDALMLDDRLEPVEAPPRVYDLVSAATVNTNNDLYETATTSDTPWWLQSYEAMPVDKLSTPLEPGVEIIIHEWDSGKEYVSMPHANLLLISLTDAEWDHLAALVDTYSARLHQDLLPETVIRKLIQDAR